MSEFPSAGRASDGATKELEFFFFFAATQRKRRAALVPRKGVSGCHCGGTLVQFINFLSIRKLFIFHFIFHQRNICRGVAIRGASFELKMLHRTNAVPKTNTQTNRLSIFSFCERVLIAQRKEAARREEIICILSIWDWYIKTFISRKSFEQCNKRCVFAVDGRGGPTRSQWLCSHLFDFIMIIA